MAGKYAKIFKLENISKTRLFFHFFLAIEPKDYTDNCYKNTSLTKVCPRLI